MALDADYCDGEPLGFLPSESLAALAIKINNIVDAFEADLNAAWDPHALPTLKQLHSFFVAVLLGVNELTYPGKTIDDLLR